MVSSALPFMVIVAGASYYDPGQGTRGGSIFLPSRFLSILSYFSIIFCAALIRPKRGQHDAMNAIREALFKRVHESRRCRPFKYFDTIPHAKLLKVVAERICDRSVLRLLKMWLKAPVVEQTGRNKRYIGGGKQNRLGTPQGGVISHCWQICTYISLIGYGKDGSWQRNWAAKWSGMRMIL